MNPKLKKATVAIFPRGFKLLFVAFLLFFSGNYLNVKATNFLKNSVQIPAAKAKPAILPKSVTTVKKTPAKTKKKAKKAIVKDSVVVEIDPANSNPPLFQKQ